MISIYHDPATGSLSDSLYDRFIMQNYEWATEQQPLKASEAENFVNKILKLYPESKVYRFHNTKQKFIYIHNKDFFISIYSYSSDYSCAIATKDLKTFKTLDEVYKEFEELENEELVINNSEVIMSPRGMTSVNRIYKLNDFRNINEKYYPFLNIDLFLKEFVYGKENILILCGEPGTGKSKFVTTIFKKLLQNKEYLAYFRTRKQKKTFKSLEELNELLNDDENEYYVTSCKNIDLVASDQFWENCRSSDFIILDDLDFLLSSRAENREDVVKNQFLSHLLSFSDGIYENKTKIIITTNQPFGDIDEALLRKGRLFGIFEFRSLTEEEALDIWLSEGLDEEKFNEIIEEIIDANGCVKQSDLGHFIDNLKRNEKIVKPKKYILDESIDALHKAKKQRAGLI